MNVVWKGDMAFEATGNSGQSFTMDAYAESGGHNSGPTPVEALLGSLAACSAMDVVSILKKKKQVVTSYRIEVSGERTPEGEWPRPFKSITIKHIISGENLEDSAVARSIQLSDEKYCTVVATLRAAPEITTTYEIK